MKNFHDFLLTSKKKYDIVIKHAGMAELADAHGSGPCGSNTMRVQVPFPASKTLFRKWAEFFGIWNCSVCVHKKFVEFVLYKRK